MVNMELTKLQKLTEKERKSIILKFQKEYKTSKDKEEVLKEMTNKDINFLIYCMDNIYGKMFYSKFLKEEL